MVVLQALYEADLTQHPAQASLDYHLEETPLSPEAVEFAQGLLKGTTEHLRAIDALIEEAAPQWPLEQIAAVDRTVLRMTIAELYDFEPLGKLKAPVKATINEAVDLAKRFGSDGSARFVNGVLGSITSKLAGAAAPKAH